MTHNLTTPCDVIAIDSGTQFEKLSGNTFEEHQKSVMAALSHYDIDEKAGFWMMVNAWDLLGMLGDYTPTYSRNLKKLNLLSIDGSDLGWNR
ncbi:unnamed protein product [Heligmosomoides polygyrus]|uniref:Peptidase A1 domain-containing protein n=1 Tax=Heligmosomoides polygyrus TaxID=6339 RepID=A0A183GUA9_HELPZ|nr:unnamed protein product [Heligmosomoides polygyrus]